VNRYADLLVHRLLAVSIGADMTYSELLSRQDMQKVCNNLNYRHKMSQYAQRSSVALHTHLFFRHKVQDEDAYILFVRQNALQVLIPKYGLEGSIYLKEKDSESSLCTYNPEVCLEKKSFERARPIEPISSCLLLVSGSFSKLRKYYHQNV